MRTFRGRHLIFRTTICPINYNFYSTHTQSQKMSPALENKRVQIHIKSLRQLEQHTLCLHPTPFTSLRVKSVTQQIVSKILIICVQTVKKIWQNNALFSPLPSTPCLGAK